MQTKQSKAEKLVRKFKEACEEMVAANTAKAIDPSVENIKKTIEAERRFYQIRGTVYRAVVNTSVEL